MSNGPFDMGRGRNGPMSSGVPMLGGKHGPAPAAPYRPDVADVDFHAVADVVVCVLAQSRQSVELGDVSLAVPEKESPFHMAVSVGAHVGEKLGVDLEPGDVLMIAGGQKIETLAGTVWFVRAEHVLSVVTKKAAAPLEDHQGETPETAA
jgi:hypothetical protein